MVVMMGGGKGGGASASLPPFSTALVKLALLAASTSKNFTS